MPLHRRGTASYHHQEITSLGNDDGDRDGLRNVGLLSLTDTALHLRGLNHSQVSVRASRVICVCARVRYSHQVSEMNTQW
jgi:hypothetical protein